MGREQSGAVSGDGGWHRAAGRSPGEASDADVRAAVESAVGGAAGRAAADGPSTFHGVDGGTTTETAVVTGGMHPDADVEPEPKPERNPDRAPGDGDVPGRPATADGHEHEHERAHPHLDARTEDETDADRATTGGTDASAPTPVAASVGVGMALLTAGVLLVAYRAMLAAGAGEFVASLYGVGGLLIVGGFVAHALWRADDVTV